MVPTTWSSLDLLAVHLGVEQEGGEVVAGVGDVVLDLLAQVLEERHHPLGALLEREGHALEHVVHEAAEAVGVLLGEAEHVGDDPHRDVLGVLLGGVDDVAVAHRRRCSSSQ